MFSILGRDKQTVIVKDVLTYEDGAILPRQNGKTERRMRYLDINLRDLTNSPDYFDNKNLKIVLVCSTKSQGKELLKLFEKKHGWKKTTNRVIISTPKTLGKDIMGYQIFDIIDDSWQLCRGSKLELDFTNG